MTLSDRRAPDPGRYGRHLREVVDAFRKLPLSEHRALCECKRCKEAKR